MLTFEPIRKENLRQYQHYYADPNALGCESNLVSGYLWSESYKLRVAVADDTLIKAYFRDDSRVWGYCFPAGKNIRGAVELIFDDAAARGQTVRIAYMTQSERDALERLFPGRFTYRTEPDNRDYIYSTRDLAALAGKKYHAKRNHISKFTRAYGDSMRLVSLTPADLGDAMEVLRQWCRENGYDPASYGECAVFQRACDDFEALGMQGMTLYAEDKPVAMTMGSPISPACFDVMFEKALRAYDGAYAVINQAFAETLISYPYLNREEDLGLEGLRKAKLSYHPVILYERYSALPK